MCSIQARRLHPCRACFSCQTRVQRTAAPQGAARGEAREVWCGIAGTARSAPRDVSTGRRARAGKPRLATGTGALSPASRTARLPRGGSEGRMAAGGGRVQPRACTRGSTRAARVWGPRHTASPPRSAPPSQPASLSAVSRGAALSSPRLTRFKPPKSRHRIGGGPKPARTRRGKMRAPAPALRVANAMAMLMVAALLCGCHGDADMTQTGPGEVTRIADVEAFEARLAAPAFQNAPPLRARAELLAARRRSSIRIVEPARRAQQPRADYPPRVWHIHMHWPPTLQDSILRSDSVWVVLFTSTSKDEVGCWKPFLGMQPPAQRLLNITFFSRWACSLPRSDC